MNVKNGFTPPPQHSIWKPIAVFLSVILVVIGLLYAFSDSKTLRASAASSCSIVVTPDWGEVPKEVVHLKDDYNLRQFEIVSLPSTMEVKRKVNFTSKQNQIAAGTDVVLSDTAHPLTLRFPKVACDLSGRDIDILLDINITLHSNRSGPSNLYPWFLAVYTKRISFTSNVYNAETGVLGHPENLSSNNSYTGSEYACVSVCSLPENRVGGGD